MKPVKRPLGRFVVAAMLVALSVGPALPATPALAATIGVACGDVPGLVGAIATANAAPGGEILLNANNVAGCTYTLTAPNNGVSFNANGLPIIATSVLIHGNGATIRRRSDPGTPFFRIVEVATGAIATLDNLTIAGGSLDPAGSSGGGIKADSGAILALINTTISGNSASEGGGIANGGTLSVEFSTVSGNSAGLSGGGIANSGSMLLFNSTVSGNAASTATNTSPTYGAGVENTGSLTLVDSTLSGNGFEGGNGQGGGFANRLGGSLTWSGSIVAGNTSNVVPFADCFQEAGPIVDNGHNLVGAGTGCPTTGPGDLAVDPATVFTAVLAPLAFNGGPTQTMALLVGSPAIDRGTCFFGDGNPVPTDQRGVPRPQGPACDVGAYERAPVDTTPPSCALTAVLAGPPKQIQITVQDTGSGLYSVLVTSANNVTVSVPPFSLGTTAPVVITATKIDQAQPAQVTLRVFDAANQTDCDPVMLDVGRTAGQPKPVTVASVHQSEHRVVVANGNPGITSLRVEVNGIKFEVAGLKHGERRILDVASALRVGNANTVTLTPLGKPGTTASVLLSD